MPKTIEGLGMFEDLSSSDEESSRKRWADSKPDYSKRTFYLVLFSLIVFVGGGLTLYLTLRWYPDQEYENQRIVSKRLFNEYLQLSSRRNAPAAEVRQALDAYRKHLTELVQFCVDHSWMPDRKERLSNREEELRLSYGL